jgi:hypothetical protein
LEAGIFYRNINRKWWDINRPPTLGIKFGGIWEIWKKREENRK